MTHAEETTPESDGLRGWRRWASTALIATFTVGMLAIWLVPGDTAGAENRTPLPWPEVSADSAANTATYRDFDAALRDRLGAQATVSSALGKMTVHLLGRSPTASVIIGSDGQPYYKISPSRAAKPRRRWLQ